MSLKLAVKNLDNKDNGSIELNADVFGLPVRADLLHRAVQWQLAARRSGNHKTKTISEISGTGKKPYKQKGTGNARQGSMRSAQMRGGATIFGPVVRSHAIDLPKKVRALALRTALSAKAAEGKLIVLNDAKAKSFKTKDMSKTLAGLGLTSALVIDGNEIDVNFARATNNIPHIDVLPSAGANVYDILRHDTLVLTKDAVDLLTARLAGNKE
jgi:large subunit ribosomal protein L4